MVADPKYTTLSSADDEEELPLAAVSAAVSTASVQQEEGDELTWTDDYFCDRNDVVAVFDYDHELLHRHYVTNFIVTPILIFNFLGMFASIIVMMANADEIDGNWFRYGLHGMVGLILLMILVCCGDCCSGLWSRLIKPRPVPHTAITNNGVRHVQPASSGHGRYNTIQIPFAAITNVTVAVTDGGSMTATAIGTASCDGAEYVVSGFPQFEKKWDGNACSETACIKMLGMSEPFRFKQLLLEMMKKSNTSPAAANATCSIELMSRIDTALDGSVDDSSAPELLLRELRDELRQHMS